MTVTGVEDSDRDDETVTLSNNPSGADYDSVDTVDVAVSVTDNDIPGVNVSTTALTVDGGEHDREQLHGGALCHPADGGCDGDGRGALRHGRDPVPNHPDLHGGQLEHAQDGDGEGGRRRRRRDDTVTLTHSATSTDTDYQGITIAGVDVTVTDNDTLGMTVTPSTLDVDEGGTAMYTVKLDTAPTGDVTVAITSNDPEAATVSPDTLTFTSQNWATAQTVTVMGVEDIDRDDESVTLSNNPSGAEYVNVSTVDVDLSVTDNDIASVSVSKTALMVGEENTTGNSYTLVLNNQPTANVTVTVAGHSGTDVTPSPITLTFTSTDWETPKTVTVTAANDADTVNDVVTLTHSAASTDIGYQDIPIASVDVTVTDNDTPGITVMPSPLDDVDEGGTTTYTVKLDTAPTGEVTVEP